MSISHDNSATLSIMDPARKAFIDKFLATLSSRETSYLQRQLRKGLPCLTDLPSELVCLVSEHLDIEDVLSCRLVSRSWNRAWDAESVASSLCRHFFLGLLQTQPSESQTPARELFLQAARRFLRRHWAPPTQRVFLPWSKGETSTFVRFKDITQLDKFRHRHSDNLDNIEPPSRLVYGDGKLAWEISYSSCVYVDDLRACTRKICSSSPPGVYTDSKLRAVTKDLLILCADPHIMSKELDRM